MLYDVELVSIDESELRGTIVFVEVADILEIHLGHQPNFGKRHLKCHLWS
jgi:hypothetical protein